ncbi:MAG: PKD domain-containing protein [Thermoplasmata archaeon]
MRTTGSAAGFLVELNATPRSGAAPLSVQLSASVSSGLPTSIGWSFGDGGRYNASWMEGQSIDHSYSLAGLYTVRASVTEASGMVTASVLVDALAGHLTVGIHASATAGLAPLKVLFEALPAGGTETYVGFHWSFGDGSNGTGTVVEHIYQAPGDYRVGLSLSDSAGVIATNETWLNATGIPSGAAAGAPLWIIYALPTGLAVLAAAVVLAVGFRLGRRPEKQAASAPAEAEAISPPTTETREEVDDPPGRAPISPGEESRAESPSRLDAPEISGGPPLSPPVAPPILPPARTEDSSLWSAPPRGPPPPHPAPLPTPRQRTREVLVRLYRLGRVGRDEVPGSEWTQSGLSQALEIPQNALSNILRRLVAADILVEELSHVRGRPRRVKIYRLTREGETLARTFAREDSPGADRARASGIHSK